MWLKVALYALTACMAACGRGAADDAAQQSGEPRHGHVVAPAISPLPNATPMTLPDSQGRGSSVFDRGSSQESLEARGGVQMPLNIIRQLLRDDDSVKQCLEENYHNNLRDLVELLDVEAVDLNRDGQVDFLVRTGNACGISQNAPAFIYRWTPRGYALMFEGDCIFVESLESSTNGYLDIKVTSHSSASVREIAVYKFIRNRYRAVECFTRIYEEPLAGQPAYRDVTHDCSQVS